MMCVLFFLFFLDRDNSKITNEKSAAGAKCDYHTLGACFEVLRVLEQR